MAENGALKVEIDPQVELPNRYLGSDEDGPHYGPMTLYDAIAETAAAKVLAKCEKGLTAAVGEAVEEKVAALLDERLEGIVQDALENKVEITDGWGAQREAKSVRDLIAEHARGQLTVSRNSMNRTVLERVVSEEIDRTLHRELGEAVQAAKAELVGKVQEAASGELAKAIAAAVTR